MAKLISENHSLFDVNSTQLEQVDGTALRKAVPSIPITLIGEPALRMSYPLENILPGTRVIIKAANILSLIMNIANPANTRINSAHKYKGLTGSQIISKF